MSRTHERPLGPNVQVSNEANLLMEQHMHLLGFRTKTGFIQAAIIHYVADTLPMIERIEAWQAEISDNGKPS